MDREDSDAAGEPAKEQRWPIALLVGLITGVAATVIVVPTAEWVMNAHHVSQVEGMRGYATVFIWMPLAFVAGFTTGIFTSLMTRGRGVAGFLKRQLLALVASGGLIGGVGALSYAAADHPPLSDGRPLALEIEVRAPANGRTIDDFKAQEFNAALVVTTSDRHYSDMRWSEAREEDGFLVVPAWSALNSRNSRREITVGVREANRQVFDVTLPAAPKQVEDAWSSWMPPRQLFDGSKPPPEDQYLVRYRVRFATEYSPTPTPPL